jgi:hypothetical protein
MKLISWKVWTQDRLFPLVPFWQWTQSKEVTWVLFGLSVGLLLFFSFLKPKIILIVLLLISEIGQLLLDQMRCQPWEYQFLLTTLFFVSFRKSETFKLLLLLLLSFTYIYSGLHKFNTGFLESNWGNLILKNIFGIEMLWKQNDLLYYGGYLIPFFETVFGLLLLFLKNKKNPIILLIFMHIGILLMLGPLGVNYNEVVWPWNILMPIFLYLIYKDQFLYKFPLSFFKLKLTQFALIFVAFFTCYKFFWLVGSLPFFWSLCQ